MSVTEEVLEANIIVLEARLKVLRRYTANKKAMLEAIQIEEQINYIKRGIIEAEYSKKRDEAEKALNSLIRSTKERAAMRGRCRGTDGTITVDAVKDLLTKDIHIKLLG